jgi:enoyl-CoA hydratase/carnithine racemase
MASQLFTIPVASLTLSKDVTGPVAGAGIGDAGLRTIICTSPCPLVYLLTFTSPPDNRLTTPFCQALILALDILEHSYPPGVVVTTSGIQKFYSNGLELEHAFSTPGFFPDSLFKLFRRFLT